MAYISRVHKDVVFNASAGATQSFNTSFLQNGGELLAAVYTQGTASGISTAAGITVRAQQSSMVLLDVTATGAAGVAVVNYPRALLTDTSGGALGFTSAATPPRLADVLPIGQECINIEIASATAGGTPAAASGGLKIGFDFYIRGG